MSHTALTTSCPSFWKPPTQTFFWLVTQSSSANDVFSARTRDESQRPSAWEQGWGRGGGGAIFLEVHVGCESLEFRETFCKGTISND